MAFYLESIRQYFANFFKKEQRQEEQVSKIEAYIGVLYKLLIWEDIALSTFVLIAAHIFFWVILQFQLQFYSILFLTLFIALVIDASLDKYIIKQTENPIPLKGIRESVQIAKRMFVYLTTLRKDHPGTFCIIMCTCFIILSIIGRAISGLFLTYLIFMLLILIPGVIKNLPITVTEPLKHAFVLISSDEGVLAESEFIPSAHDDDNIDDAESTKTDQTAESIGSSFISGVTSMPSYLEAEGSIDGLEEEDLLPRNIREITPSNLSTDSSDSEHQNIKFETKHFNGDSSSEDDTNLEKGLTFAEVDLVDKPDDKPTLTQQLGTDLLSNIGAMGSSIVSTVFKTTSTAKKRPAKKSDSDSDFEIIDEFPNSDT